MGTGTSLNTRGTVLKHLSLTPECTVPGFGPGALLLEWCVLLGCSLPREARVSGGDVSVRMSLLCTVHNLAHKGDVVYVHTSCWTEVGTGVYTESCVANSSLYLIGPTAAKAFGQWKKFLETRTAWQQLKGNQEHKSESNWSRLKLSDTRRGMTHEKQNYIGPHHYIITVQSEDLSYGAVLQYRSWVKNFSRSFVETVEKVVSLLNFRLVYSTKLCGKSGWFTELCWVKQSKPSKASTFVHNYVDIVETVLDSLNFRITTQALRMSWCSQIDFNRIWHREVTEAPHISQSWWDTALETGKSDEVSQ